MSSGLADDLPRTLRRERELRERGIDRNSVRTGDSAPFAAMPSPRLDNSALPELQRTDDVVIQGNVVTDIQIPFFRLMWLCFKLLFAAIPALVLLGCLMWLAGHLLISYAPWLVKMQVLIRVP